MLAGCGGGGSDAGDDAGPPDLNAAVEAEQGRLVPVTASALQGRWRSNCYVDLDGGGIVATEVYSGSEIVAHGEFHDNADCSYPLFEVGIVGTFSLGAAAYAGDGSAVTEIDYSTRAVSITPADADFAGFLNAAALCARRDWRVGESREVTTCAELEPALAGHDIIQLDGDRYRIGEYSDELDGSAPDRRPTSIDHTIEYRRILDDGPAGPTVAPGGATRDTPSAELERQLERLRSFAARGTPGR